MKAIVFIVFLLKLQLYETIQISNSKIYRNIHVKPGPCFKNQTEYPFIYEQKHMKIVGGIDKIWINLKHDVLRDLHGPFKVVTKVSRCSLSDHNDCEAEASFTVPDVCLLQDYKTMTRIVFGPMMAFEPPIDCTNKVQRKGTYFIKNYTMNLLPARLMPIGGYLWRLRDMRSFGNVENLLCINIDVIVRNAK